MEPNKENLLKWVEALESGEFKQTTGQLTKVEINGDNVTEIKHCCLGVACVIAAQNGVRVTRDGDLWRYVGTYGTEEYSEGALPAPVVSWLGVDGADPYLRHDDGDSRASELNDTYGWSFEKIASAIRRTYDLGEKS